MSSSFMSLAVGCVLMTALQLAAMIPWLLAVQQDARSRLRTGKFWWSLLGLAVIVGLAWGWRMDQAGDPKVLTRWGRVYGSILHLQLSADFLVLMFWGMLRLWPKGGAVALAAFKESVRQPMFLMVLLAFVFLMAGSPFIPYFTFGEDLKMVKELCFAFAMLAPAAFGVLAAAISVSEEIEGRTAVTVMSKPISRRQFLLGKFLGILLSSMTMAMLLGWTLVWVILAKVTYDGNFPGVETQLDPAWVSNLMQSWFPDSSVGDLVKGWGFWVNDATLALPGLVMGFGQVMVLVAIATALATRMPMLVTLTLCLVVYFLGHLTPIMTEVTRGEYRLVYFVAQVFDTILPGLDNFDVGSAIIRDLPLPAASYALFTLNTALYALTYTAIALLFGLVLFEDRDLA
jgi:ABC-type transport system involved in multi-copper enzyme maturation permease subunit